MTTKEYRNKLEMIDKYNRYDYLLRAEVNELRRDIKARKNARPLDGSNYKASIRTDGGGVILTSYYTDVARVDNTGFTKLWEGFSATTLKHVNIFRDLFGLPAINKREWVEM